jgi:hypothetical protein
MRYNYTPTTRLSAFNAMERVTIGNSRIDKKVNIR